MKRRKPKTKAVNKTASDWVKRSKGPRLRWSGSSMAQQEADAAFAEYKKRVAAKNRKPTYAEYLSSGEWKKKRKEALDHHGRKCQVCGQRRQLNVHHKNYLRVGCELMSDLEVLCHPCHQNRHEKDGVHDPLTREFIAMFKPNP